MLLVIIRATEPPRIAEALRIALGLGLRGDTIEVWLTTRGPLADHGEPPDLARAWRTLLQLGHQVIAAPESPFPADLAQRIRAADAVQVWT